MIKCSTSLESQSKILLLLHNYLQSCYTKFWLFHWSFGVNSSLSHVQPQVFQCIHLLKDRQKEQKFWSSLRIKNLKCSILNYETRWAPKFMHGHALASIRPIIGNSMCEQYNLTLEALVVSHQRSWTNLFCF